MTAVTVQASTAEQAVATWLDAFNAALAARDADAAADLFATTSFWRDLVALTWNLKTVEGREGVHDLLAHTLDSARPRDFRTSEAPAEAGGVIESWLDFETEVGRGRGHLRLKDGLAWTLLTTLYELKGHEERRGRSRSMGAEHGIHPDRRTWLDNRRDEVAELGRSRQPEVLIIGGGQGGIALAARLRQLDVP
ncbi:MAG: NAD(P)/FAD-dependent oxidoreductase, partial [Solirubrobacteraceae bacterium]